MMKKQKKTFKRFKKCKTNLLKIFDGQINSAKHISHDIFK